MTNVDTGVVYVADHNTGSFVAEDGSTLPVGWRVVVGFQNFTKALTDPNYAGPLLKVTAWTFAFAILTVLSSFFVGLILAIIFNDDRVRGRKVWRTLFILPYAFPAFMSALLWKGMLNRQFGIINDWFFGGANIPWLAGSVARALLRARGEPLAELSVLVLGVHGRAPGAPQGDHGGVAH